MIMSWIWTAISLVAILCSVILGKGSALASSVLQGATAGINLALAIGGSLCLWTGVGRLMERGGILELLSKICAPALHRLFPSSRRDPELCHYLSANICANFLGLGNAATPMGIQAAKGMAGTSAVASNELCRLIVLNTASIQLIPANVAAVRAGLGCATPFDILPAVWITSLCSAGLGLTAAGILGKLWRHD